jgi:ketosteroid isomerase-like protein
MGRALVLALAVSCFSGCSQADDTTTNDPAALRAAESEVYERLFSYPAIVKAGRVDSIMTFWAPDVRVFDKEVRVNGDSALRRIGDEFFAAYEVTRLAYAPAESFAHDGGAVVYQFGYFTEDMRRKGATAITNTRSNYVARWVKDDAGKWRIHRMIAVPSPQKPAATATIATVAPAANAEPGDRTSVEQRMTAYVTALRSNDLPAIMAFWAEDGRLVEPEVELNDKPAINTFLENVLGTNRVESLELTTEEVFLHDRGTVAYQLGRYTERTVRKNGGAAATSRNHYLARWKKSSSGEWLLDRFYGTPVPRERSQS